MTIKYKSIARKSLAVLSIAALLAGCVNKDEFFLLEDRSGIDAAIWSTQGAVEMHLRETYDKCVPRFPQAESYDRLPIHLASDETYFSGSDTWARAALGVFGTLAENDVRFVGNKYQGNNFGDNLYFDIARCNAAITYIPQGTMSDELKKNFLGQYYALRAIVYFELVKVYGGVPLLLTPQNPNSITVGGRASAKQCFEQILADLDLAMEDLKGMAFTDANDRGRITPEIVACLKAKVLLYWASPQFNPKDDPKHPYDASRWNVALQANKAAYDMCIAGQRKLMTNYADIFRVEGATNTEAIFVRSYSSTIERRGHDIEYKIRPSSEGGNADNQFIPTTILLNAYPMKDGSPIGTSPTYTYDPVMFWQNRDPRFEATFAYNGSLYPLSGKTTRKQWTYVSASGESSSGYGVYSKKFATPGLAQASVRYTNNLGGSGMDWIELRFAEVMLNYAECANATGDIETAKSMVREIRKRAGIEAGNNDYGIGSVGSDPDKMVDFIANERFIEFAFENKRNADLRRLRKWHKLSGTGTIQTLRIELQAPNDNTKNNNHLTAINANTGLPNRDTLNINKKSTYLYYFKPAVQQTSGNAAFSIPEFHYFYTFHNDFMNSSPLLQPTIGWPSGTFDPLD